MPVSGLSVRENELLVKAIVELYYNDKECTMDDVIRIASMIGLLPELELFDPAFAVGIRTWRSNAHRPRESG